MLIEKIALELGPEIDVALVEGDVKINEQV
ncbi:hypothetical protein HRbin02_00379 [Candidatus Calditenuaceae archaeon HR02]|nr:hypothetical protein HRbin02_00379 [Candidatus Calditenuaceae archaeon HR02]